MHRLFVALRPPPHIRAALLALMEGVANARWQDDDQLHLTLRFIGEVDRHLAEDVAATLAGVAAPPVTLAIAGTGAFDRKGHAHTLWAGIAADPALLRLQASVERALVRAGLPPEPRTFRPHVTLARLNRSAGAIGPWLAATAGLRAAPVAIDSFLLFESVLGPSGASYEAIARYPLVR